MKEYIRMGEAKSVKIDPNDEYDADVIRIKEACGILLNWGVQAIATGHPLKPYLDSQYGFGLFEMTGGRIDDQNVMHYPAEPVEGEECDPPLHPYALVEGPEELLILYPSAVVAIKNKESGEFFVTRMD